MKAEYIHSFLDSARMVIEQMANVRPSAGSAVMKELQFPDHQVCIRIGLTGALSGDVRLGLSKTVALRLISAMTGGRAATEIDELGRSAMSELGNMIGGNASTMLSHHGVAVDITTPSFTEGMPPSSARRALTVPLRMDGIGEMEIQMLIA